MSSRAHKNLTAAIVLGLVPTTLQLTNEIDASATITTDATETSVWYEIENMLDDDYSTRFN